MYSKLGDVYNIINLYNICRIKYKPNPYFNRKNVVLFLKLCYSLIICSKIPH